MVDRQQIKWIATQTIRARIRQPHLQTIVDEILRPDRFNRFIEGLWVRCNQLEVAGYLNNKYALQQFVQTAVVYYAHRLVVKMEKQLDVPNGTEPTA